MTVPDSSRAGYGTCGLAPVAGNQFDARVAPVAYISATSSDLSEVKVCWTSFPAFTRREVTICLRCVYSPTFTCVNMTAGASTIPLLVVVVMLLVCAPVALLTNLDPDADIETGSRALSRLTLSRIIGGRGSTREAVWERPGCHKVGHTRKVSIPDCVEFTLSTNACRGYCESWSIPSSLETVAQNPHQPVTSIGQCCSMMDTEEIEVNVMCIDGVRNLKFKSALSCSCYHCKKE